MKKLLGIVFCLILLCACSSCGKEVDKEALANFVGSWDCQESTREQMDDEDYIYVGYLQLDVEEDGSFSLYDVEAGNPALSGVMYPDHEQAYGTVLLDCKGEFDPPVVWAGMEKDVVLDYRFFSFEGKPYLILSYVDEEGNPASLYFEQME